MARRSATNARYQKYQEPAGQTRKSAAAAKPKRSSNAAPVKKNGKSSGSTSKGSSAAARRAVMVNPTTPEFKRIRKIWWGLLLGGLVLTTLSWVVRDYLNTPWATTASNVVLGFAYAAIFYALYLDWTKLRPMRQAAYKSAKTGKPEKAAASDKPTAKAEKPAAKPKKSADKTADDTTDTTGA